MPFVKAGMHEFLLVGRGGRLVNRGTAVHAYLRPGTVFALVPSAKQEAAFEFTQETKDGIPLRFKGIAVYRITDPVAAAALFDFSVGGASGTDRITTMLTHVCLGELRHAVSHMTMVECIEQRKTTLSDVAAAALRTAVDGDGSGSWGVTVEIAQVAQVYIVDADLRRQLEAEVRNEIRRQADQSDRRTEEAAALEAMASEGRISDQRLAGDREGLRREEELERARIENRRRMQTEELDSQRLAIRLEQERLHAQVGADRDRLDTETPLRLLRAAREREVIADELELRRLQLAVAALEVDRDLLRPRADQELRLRMLPIEQAPQIVEAGRQAGDGGDRGARLGRSRAGSALRAPRSRWRDTGHSRLLLGRTDPRVVMGRQHGLPCLPTGPWTDARDGMGGWPAVARRRVAVSVRHRRGTAAVPWRRTSANRTMPPSPPVLIRNPSGW